MKENLVYNFSPPKMVGFVDIGEERTVSTAFPDVVTHAFELYIRSIMTNFLHPLAFFATKSLKSYQLTSIVLEAIAALHCF